MSYTRLDSELEDSEETQIAFRMVSRKESSPKRRNPTPMRERTALCSRHKPRSCALVHRTIVHDRCCTDLYSILRVAFFTNLAFPSREFSPSRFCFFLRALVGRRISLNSRREDDWWLGWLSETRNGSTITPKYLGGGGNSGWSKPGDRKDGVVSTTTTISLFRLLVNDTKLLIPRCTFILQRTHTYVFKSCKNLTR